MSFSTDRNQIPCLKCKEPCCKFVKHMPYMGERDLECFKTLLIGAFPPFESDKAILQKEYKRLFVTEWIVPAELSRCIAYSSDGLCKIYENRPISCRNFPLISNDSVHKFCPHGSNFLGQPFLKPPFLKKLDEIDLILLDIFKQNGEEGLAKALFSNRPFNLPLLYNSYLVLVLILAGVNVKKALMAQYELLEMFLRSGLNDITVIIPGSEHCISGEIDGLKANLQYLLYQIKEEILDKRLEGLLGQLSCLKHRNSP